MEDEILDVDSLIKPVGKARIFGQVHDVLPANGNVIEIMQKLARQEETTGAPGNHLELARHVVGECVPTLSKDQLNKLNIEQLTLLIGRATGTVERVRRMVAAAEGNGSSPAERKGSPGRKSSTK